MLVQGLEKNLGKNQARHPSSMAHHFHSSERKLKLGKL
ncbi:hypothetical protein P872_20955 [Rhodonellum psychrophilum GCM71 = DSM 17998]|uniref:Uncharacterized protein n=1 Tax=Rhodonellum psychrophilum GCM71 = DSM 17998 TaxID=1123057 RepID=U5BKU0_9BACT|nr:hypothetical protein P872_20955 [Rhodonellum psychrophilum GCM71 = DSM 17998]